MSKVLVHVPSRSKTTTLNVLLSIHVSRALPSCSRPDPPPGLSVDEEINTWFEDENEESFVAPPTLHEPATPSSADAMRTSQAHSVLFYSGDD